MSELGDLDTLLSNIEDMIARFGKRAVCEKILEDAEFLDPYDKRMDIVFEVLNKHCGRTYMVKLKQALKSRLIARKSPVSPEIIGILGTHAARLIHEVFNEITSPMELNRIISEALRGYGIEFTYEEHPLPGFVEMYRKAIEVANKYALLLEKMGAFDIVFFAREYARGFEVKGARLSTEKAIIASTPLFLSIGTNRTVLERVVESIGENFNAVVGFSIAAGYTLIRYVSREVKYYPWASLLSLLGFGEREAISLYQKARSGDFGLIIDILSRIIGTYYHGSIGGLIEAANRWHIRLEYIEKLLFSASYAMSGIGHLMELIDLASGIATKGLREKGVENFIFELLNKISLEVRPAVLRRFLEMEKTRRKIIGIIENVPSALVLYAVNRLVRGFLPLDIAKKIAEEQDLHADIWILNRHVPNWRDILDIKTKLYLGVIDNA